ncbi:hypothetical protein GCM10027360_12020 [Amycolatopsis echigonensis]
MPGKEFAGCSPDTIAGFSGVLAADNQHPDPWLSGDSVQFGQRVRGQLQVARRDVLPQVRDR